MTRSGRPSKPLAEIVYERQKSAKNAQLCQAFSRTIGRRTFELICSIGAEKPTKSVTELGGECDVLMSRPLTFVRPDTLEQRQLTLELSSPSLSRFGQSPRWVVEVGAHQWTVEDGKPAKPDDRRLKIGEFVGAHILPAPYNAVAQRKTQEFQAILDFAQHVLTLEREVSGQSSSDTHEAIGLSPFRAPLDVYL